MPNIQNLKYWEKGKSGNPKGRPREEINEWLEPCFGKKRAKTLKESRMSQKQIDAWEQTFLVLTSAECQLIAKWEGAPMYAKNLAMSLLFDTKNGKTNTIDKLRERQYGKPLQRVEMTGANGKPLNPEPLIVEIIDRAEQVRAEEQNEEQQSE